MTDQFDLAIASMKNQKLPNLVGGTLVFQSNSLKDFPVVTIPFDATTHTPSCVVMFSAMGDAHHSSEKITFQFRQMGPTTFTDTHKDTPNPTVTIERVADHDLLLSLKQSNGTEFLFPPVRRSDHDDFKGMPDTTAWSVDIGSGGSVKAMALGKPISKLISQYARALHGTPFIDADHHRRHIHRTRGLLFYSINQVPYCVDLTVLNLLHSRRAREGAVWDPSNRNKNRRTHRTQANACGLLRAVAWKIANAVVVASAPVASAPAASAPVASACVLLSDKLFTRAVHSDFGDDPKITPKIYSAIYKEFGVSDPPAFGTANRSLLTDTKVLLHTWCNWVLAQAVEKFYCTIDLAHKTAAGGRAIVAKIEVDALLGPGQYTQFRHHYWSLRKSEFDCGSLDEMKLMVAFHGVQNPKALAGVREDGLKTTFCSSYSIHGYGNYVSDEAFYSDNGYVCSIRKGRETWKVMFVVLAILGRDCDAPSQFQRPPTQKAGKAVNREFNSMYAGNNIHVVTIDGQLLLIGEIRYQLN